MNFCIPNDAAILQNKVNICVAMKHLSKLVPVLGCAALEILVRSSLLTEAMEYTH